MRDQNLTKLQALIAFAMMYQIKYNFNNNLNMVFSYVNFKIEDTRGQKKD